MAAAQSLLRVGFVTLVLAVPAGALADEWRLAEPRADVSANDRYAFIQTPRAIRDLLSYFQDKVAARPRPGQDPDGPDQAMGRLELWQTDGTAREVWRRALLNDVAPVSSIVADDGRHVVTFDNWHAMGLGDDVIVIYGPGGDVVRQFALADLMSEAQVKALPRTVSSIWWGGRHRFDDGDSVLVLEIAADKEMFHSRKGVFRAVRIALADGRILADPAFYRVSRRGRALLDMVDAPGNVTGVGAAPAPHPFLSAEFTSLEDESAIRFSLRRSRSTAHFIANLRRRGYTVTRQ